MKQEKPITSYKWDVRKIGREVLLKAGLRLPEKINIIGKLKAKDIPKTWVYVLWNKGEIKLSVQGGKDCIAKLRRTGKIIEGWSI